MFAVVNQVLNKWYVAGQQAKEAEEYCQ